MHDACLPRRWRPGRRQRHPRRQRLHRPLAVPAQVKEQDDAARQASQQSAAVLKAAAKPPANVIDGVTIPAGATNTAEYIATVKALQQQHQHGVYYSGCSGRLFQLGACPSEAGLAGVTPEQVKQAMIGAGMVWLSAVPAGDILDLLGTRGEAAEDTVADIPSVIYRGGGKAPSNFRLRPGENALSFRDSLSNPLPPGRAVLLPGKEYVGIDTSQLPAVL